jgi:hypothetical protein
MLQDIYEAKRTLVNVRKNTTLGDGNVAEELVQFFIVTDSKLQMARNDTGLLVVASSISSQLKNFGSEIFKHSSKINGSTWREKVRHKKGGGESDTQSYQHRHVERSYPYAGDGGHGRQGTQGPPWTNA